MQNIYHVSFTVFFVVDQIGLNSLKRFVVRATKIYKLLDQNSLLYTSDTQNNQNNGAYDPVMLVFAN